ncbi:MAG TPA: hypothetical protein VHE53_04110, partial [Patescibacteria group bacterium]|nr:hypothetical protein [Patescibacteria group bacterium]
MRSKIILALLFAVIVSVVFFHQILKGYLPFPGDLLVGNQEPYKSYSYQGFAPGAVPNKAQGPDVIKQLVPWKKFVTESLKKGQIPFWDPYNFSGNPLMANFQSGVFYPLNLMFITLSFPNAWTIYIVLTPILSIIFMYLFLDRFNLKPAASLLGGISFAFCLYMVVWMEYGNIGHTLLWLPLILYFTDRFIEKPTRINFLGIFLASLLSILAGYIQGFFYIYAVVVIYYFVKSISIKKIKTNNTVVFLLGLLFPVLVAAPQILLTLGLFGYSTRGNYTLEQIQKNLNPIYYLVTTIIPDFFGNPASRNFWFDGTYIERVSYFGLIPFVFAIFAISTLFKKIEVKIFSILFIFTLFISTDFFITRFFYLIPIPVISTTVATRILSVFSFCGAILAAFG